MSEQLPQAIKTVAQWENYDRFRVTEAEKSLWSNGVEPDDVAIARELVRVASQLTAAQQRVAELERESTEQAALIESHVMRIQQLDAALRNSNEKTLHRMTEAGRLDGDNARLREAIQSVLGYGALPARYREELESAING